MPHHLHNKVLNIEHINIHSLKNELCVREDLLESDEVNLIEDKINSKNDILFLGNDLTENFPSMEYQMILYGILPCGSKTVIEITGIEPYIDIKGDNNITESENISNIRQMLCNNDLNYTKLKINIGKEFMLYNENESYFIRIFFKSLKNRKDAIKYFGNVKITTYNNDISCYYRVVARDYKLNLTSWNILSNYRIIFNSYLYKTKYHIKIDINDIKPYNDGDYLLFKDIPKKLLQLDKSISMCFDIEAYAGNKYGSMPCGKNVEDILFMLCMTYQFINSKKYLLNICLVTNPCDAQEDLFTIVCHTESNLIKLFAIINELIQPDFITEFNGSDFDWPFLMDKAESFNVIPFLVEHMSIKKLTDYDLNVEKILKWQYREERVKAEADRYVISRNLNLQGYLPFDTRIVFKQLYPTESKSSLNHYLMLNNLGSKDDMPIAELFRIFREGTATEMKLVAHYCFIDSWKLHLLNIRKNVIQDKREVCKLSYTSMFDGFYRANGLKVRNLIISQAIPKNLYINNYRPHNDDDEEEKGKYPGAIVLNPIKGLVSPVYTISEFNNKISNNKLKQDDLDILQKYICDNYDDIYINKTINKNINYEELNNDLQRFTELYIDYLKENEFKYPISGLDFSSLYPSLIMAYNLSPEFLITDKKYYQYLKNKNVDLHEINFQFNESPIVAWTVRHNENSDISNFGLYPSILKFLFNERKQMKKNLFKYKEQKEHFENTVDYENNAEYLDCVFNLSYVDSKQKALKVFMNTFYGELGNQRSPLFVLPLAGGVTSSGQYNLMMIHDHVKKRKCKIYYGDSVTGDTPIIIKRNDNIEVISIEDLNWYNTNSEIIQSGEKELIYDNITEVYTEDGWTKIKKCIRHYTTKDLFRITTHMGSVIVTEDHSLLDNNKQKIKPGECKIGTELLHWENLNITKKLDKINILSDLDSIKEIKENIAFVYGFFYGDGSCGRYECPSGIKYSFALNNQNTDILNKCINIFNLYHTDVKLKLLDTIKSSSVYKANAAGNISKLVNLWRTYFYSNKKYKKVPNFILNSDNETKLLFLQGYYLADGDKKVNRMCNKGQIGSQGLYLLLHSLGYNVSINTRQDKLDIYRLSFTKNKQRKNPNSIKKIEYIGKSNDYVYDLETESHHFAAGVGKMVVHNTDSLYISCPKQCFANINKKYYTNQIKKEEYCNSLVKKTFKAIDLIKDEVNTVLFKDNGTPYLKMAYEEVLFPVVFLAKKKYYGIPHEGIVNFKPKDLFIRGLEVKKRGVSELLKKVCLNIMWDSVSLDNIFNIRELVEHKISYIFSNKWDIKDFVQTAVWKPEKQNITINTFVDRMKSINGKIPEPYERFKFVVIKKYPYKYDLRGRQLELKKGDKIEYLERAIDENLEIDLMYYFEGELTGQFARLISYDNEFEEYLENGKVDDDKTFKNCQKYILQLSDKYNCKFINRGKIFKDIYRSVNKKIKTKKIYDDKLDFIIKIGNELPDTGIEYMLLENIKNYADNTYNYNKMSNNIIDNYKNKYGNKKYINKLHNMYCNSSKSYYSKLNISIDVDITANKNKLMELLLKDDLYKTIFNLNSINIEKIINHIKNRYELDKMCIDNDSNIHTLDDICDEDEVDEILNDEDLYYNINDSENIYNIYLYIIKLSSLYSRKKLNSVLFELIHKKLCYDRNIIQAPSNFNKNDFIYGTY